MENQILPHIFVLFPLGTSPSTVLSTAGHKKKLEVGHSTVKFQEKKGEWKETLKLRISENWNFLVMSRMLLNFFSSYVSYYFPKYSQLLLLWTLSVRNSESL